MKIKIDVSFGYIKSENSLYNCNEITNTINNSLISCYCFLDIKSIVGIAVKVIDDDEMKHLNSFFLGKDGSTNVLSFPFDENIILKHLIEKKSNNMVFLGDIAVSLPTIMKESSEQEKSFTDHLSHMCVHSMLHLLGYDHISGSDAEVMESLEIEILRSMGISNPYC